MEVIMPVMVGILFTGALFMMLRPNLIRVGLGLILLTNATNLFLFSSGRLTRLGPPIITPQGNIPEPGYANPVSQALILTAIVIGFGFLSFAVAFVYRSLIEFQSQNSDVIAGKEVSEDQERD